MSDRLMTYPELADFLGRSEEAARQFAKRRRWRRTISNEDGRARVYVPEEFLEAPRPLVEPRPDDRSDPEQPGDEQPDTLTVVAMLQAQISRLENDLSGTRAALDAERIRSAQVDVLRAVLDAERSRIEEMKAAEARRVEDLKTERDRWMAQADKLIPLATPAPSWGWWPFRRSA